MLLRHPLALALAALALTPAAAAAADAVISFDDQPAGTPLQNQYTDFPGAAGSKKGVVFGVSPTSPGGGAGILPRVMAAPPGAGASGANVASIVGCHAEVCLENTTWGRFSFQRVHLAVRIGTTQTIPGDVTVTAYDAGGHEIGHQTLPVGAGPMTAFDLATSQASIVFYDITSPDHFDFFFDDLTYDNPVAPPPPDFGLVYQAPQLSLPDASAGMTKGETLIVSLSVTRVNGATGNLSFTVGGLPTGITGTLLPPSPTAASVVTLRLVASQNAQTTNDALITVTATPGPGDTQAGPAPRSASFRLDVFTNYDMRITGLEVTQGVQREVDPCFDATACMSNVSLQRNDVTPGASIPYAGVRLVRGKKTAVRVFANLRFPAGGSEDGISLRLRGFAGGKELTGSPIVAGPATLKGGGSWVTFLQRADPLGQAFVLVLPNDWTIHGPLELRAELVPPVVFIGDKECDGTDCGKNNVLDMVGIGFVGTGFVTVATANMYLKSAPWSETTALALDPRDWLSAPSLWFPLADGEFRFSAYSYYATIDASDVAKDNPDFRKKDVLPDQYKGARKSFRSAMRSRLVDYADDYPGCAWADFCADMITGAYIKCCGGVSSGKLPGQPVSVATRSSGTTVAHELGHGLGRVHADLVCGGNENGETGEAWPPDDRGHIQGIGYDIRKPFGGGIPFAVKAAGAYGAPSGIGDVDKPQPDHYDDFMTYCDGGAWNSPRGWEKTITFLLDQKGKLNHRPTPRPHAGTPPRTNIYVVAEYNIDSTLSWDMIKPSGGNPRRGPDNSPFVLVVKNAAGGEIARSPMTFERQHPDNEFLLGAEVPAVNPASVEILLNGLSVGSKAASAHAPTVTVKAPRAGARIAGRARTVKVTWSATDADGDRLQVRIDYAVDGGKTWRPIWFGPNTGSVSLAARYFARSARARIRVRAEDGFRETAAVSGPLVSLGVPPTVQIIDPAGGSMFADQPAYLSGQAFDDLGRALSGKALTWYDGARLIGRGAKVSALLASGQRTIRLVARDRFGRTAERRVKVRVTPVAPQFLAAKSPATVSRKARTVRLTVQSSIVATLRIGSQRFVVDRRARRLTIRIKPGAAPLVLTLTLAAGDRSTVRKIRIAR